MADVRNEAALHIPGFFQLFDLILQRFGHFIERFLQHAYLIGPVHRHAGVESSRCHDFRSQGDPPYRSDNRTHDQKNDHPDQHAQRHAHHQHVDLDLTQRLLLRLVGVQCEHFQ